MSLSSCRVFFLVGLGLNYHLTAKIFFYSLSFGEIDGTIGFSVSAIVQVVLLH